MHCASGGLDVVLLLRRTTMRLMRFLPRFRRAYRELEILAARECWPRAEIQAFQLKRLNEIWAHAVGHVPYYRRLAQERRLPICFQSLSEFGDRVPVLSKAVV